MARGRVVYIGWLWLQIDGWLRPNLFGTTEWLMNARDKYFGRTTDSCQQLVIIPIPNTAHVLRQLPVVAFLVIAFAAVGAAI